MKTSTLISLALAAPTLAIELDATNTQQLASTAQTVAKNIMTFDPQHGKFPQLPDWYWWIGGAAWDTFLSYSAFSNDTQFDGTILGFVNDNVGPKYDFVVLANSQSEAQDDQMFWTMIALTGLELDVTPDGIACPADKPGCHPFMDLATNSYADYVARWHAASDTCGGGLTWGFQNIAANKGQMTYKNTVTNGAFFQVSARLARYTGEQKYADWADKAWNWMTDRGIITDDFTVYDGVDSGKPGCNKVTLAQWSYNTGLLMYGAAAMADYNHGLNQTWLDRATHLTDAAIHKFTMPTAKTPGVLFEAQNDCERRGTCDTDQQTFKGYLARWMGRTASLSPKLRPRIENVLRASSEGAAHSCTGGTAKTNCGSQWYIGGFTGDQISPSLDLAAFDTFVALLGIDHAPLKAQQ